MRVIFLPGWKLAKVSRGICVCIEDEANLKYWSWFSLEKFSVFTVSWRLHIFIPRSSSFQREGKENQVRIIFSPGNKVAKSNTKFGIPNGKSCFRIRIYPIPFYLFTLGNLNLSDKLWELKKFFFLSIPSTVETLYPVIRWKDYRCLLDIPWTKGGKRW